MLKAGFVALASHMALLSARTAASAQDPVRSGIYQIQSGLYIEIGGFAGYSEDELPTAHQTFVLLTIGSGDGAAELRFLANDQQTVFRRLTNGVVAGNAIQFQYATEHPYVRSLPAWVDYNVANAAGQLWINGGITSSPVCCDIPCLMWHQGVQAVFMPALRIQCTNGVELSWSSASNQNYQVQRLSDLTREHWTNLGGPMRGNGTTDRVIDAVAPGVSQRFYRVLAWP